MMFNDLTLNSPRSWFHAAGLVLMGLEPTMMGLQNGRWRDCSSLKQGLKLFASGRTSRVETPPLNIFWWIRTIERWFVFSTRLFGTHPNKFRRIITKISASLPHTLGTDNGFIPNFFFIVLENIFKFCSIYWIFAYTKIYRILVRFSLQFELVGEQFYLSIYLYVLK